MSEQDNSSKNEQMREFWDGHSFNDDCSITQPQYAPRSLKDELGCMLVVPVLVESLIDAARESRQRRQIYDDLRAYLTIKQGSPIKRLADGEVFDLSQYTKGTIIHYSQDSEAPDYHSPFSRSYWGILTEEKSRNSMQDIVYSFTESQLSENRRSHLRGGIFSGSPNIGEVTHSKYKEPPPFSVLQYLNRYNWVEIWKFGQEVRARQSVAQGILGRVLKPSQTHNIIV